MGMLHTIFNKKHTESPISASIAFYNANGTDTSSVALKLANLLSTETSTTLLVEFPCQSIPRLAFHFDVELIEKKASIDQLLIDYERKQFRAINDYITKIGHLDLIPIHPKNKPDSPVILKLNEQNTLIEMPQYIQEQIGKTYSYTLFPLQGQLIHPMTFFTLRQADLIVMVLNDESELPWTYATYKKLIDDYNIQKESIVVFSERTNHRFNELEMITRVVDIIKKIPEPKR